MVEFGPATECEVILAFLRAEVDSSRYGEMFVLPGIASRGLSRSQLIDQADLANAEQNAARRAILEEYRGFGRNVALFRGFPGDVAWRRVQIEPADHKRLRVANYPPLVKLTEGTRTVSVLADRIPKGEITDGPAERVEAVQKALTAGNRFPELICVEGLADELILVEGHTRAIAYVGLRWTCNIDAFLGSSPSMQRWWLY